MRSHAAHFFRLRAVVALALLTGALALTSCTARVTFDPGSFAQVRVSATVADGFLIVRVPASRPSSGIDVRGEQGVAFHLPPGHYPPPGTCRIWDPGVPPGQQEPPGDCDDLERRVPRGSYLIYG